MMEIYTCKYAYDKNDEYCAKCDGIQIKKGEELLPATRCNGYEADTSLKQEIPEEARANVVQEIEKVVDETQNETTVKENNFTPLPEEELPFDISEKQESKGPVEYQRKNEQNNEGMTTKITFMSGATLSINNGEVFYKFECTEERIITPDMNVADEREKLWATINSEIDKQLEDVKNSN